MTPRPYAWGWRVDSPDGSILGHDGTYFRFYATARIYKNQGFIATACANSGNHDGDPELSEPIPAGAQRGSTAALSLHDELVNKSLIASS